MDEPITVLGGTLLREGLHAWRWRDGMPEPRVTDLSPDEWNFRCRTYGSGQTYVEVMRGVAMESEALAWVVANARAGRYGGGLSGDHAGPRVLTESGARRMHVRPGEDPLLGHEPLPEAPGPIPRVILVPVEDWDAWVREHPAGATWPREHEAEILERARSLGWQG